MAAAHPIFDIAEQKLSVEQRADSGCKQSPNIYTILVAVMFPGAKCEGNRVE